MKKTYLKELAKLREFKEHECYFSAVTQNGHSYNIFNDPAHGYLIVRPDDINYHIACGCKSNFSFELSDKTIALEEDCDASDFLNKI